MRSETRASWRRQRLVGRTCGHRPAGLWRSVKLRRPGYLRWIWLRRVSTGPADALECDGGFADALAGTTDLERVVRDLGVVWESTFHYLKPFVGCKLTHPARQGIQKLKRDNDLDPAEVDGITVYHPLYDIAIIGGHPEVGGDEVSHSVSSPYLMANTLLYDDDGPDVLGRDRRLDPDVHELAARITVAEDPELTRIYAGGMEARGEAGTPVRMDVFLKTGETHTYATSRVKGDPFSGLGSDRRRARRRNSASTSPVRWIPTERQP